MIPLIPGYTATEENLNDIALFLRECGLSEYSFTGYNPSGIDKLNRLGRQVNSGLDNLPMTLENELYLKKYFESKFNSYQMSYNF